MESLKNNFFLAKKNNYKHTYQFKAKMIFLHFDIYKCSEYDECHPNHFEP